MNETFIENANKDLTALMTYIGGLDSRHTDNQTNYKLVSKWSALLRAKKDLTKTDVAGWAKFVPDSVKKGMLNRKKHSSTNEMRISKYITQHEIEVFLTNNPLIAASNDAKAVADLYKGILSEVSDSKKLPLNAARTVLKEKEYQAPHKPCPQPPIARLFTL